MSTPCGICTRLVGDRLALCEVCGRTLVDALLAVPSLLADLETARSGQARVTDGRAGGRSAEAPLPIKDTSSEQRGRGVRLLGERDALALSTALHGWARVLADHLGAEVPIESRALAVLAANARHTGGSVEAPAVVHECRLRDGVRVRESRVALRTAAHLITPVQTDERLAVWLASHPLELRQLDAVEQAYHDIVNATGALRRAIDRPSDRRYLGRCPTVVAEVTRWGEPTPARAVRCEANLWADESSWVRCPRCHVQHEVARIEAAATEAAREMLCTMPELLHACAAVGSPIARRTGYRWAAEGRLTRRAWLIRSRAGVRITDRHEDGAVPVYRVGDALELARRETIESGSRA
ncbi:hypothetical protein ATM97_07045 [Nocardia sp. MH4]|uniref:hypothetical protein n=1 Tax=Nocardia sp. MH4 TaxID=1768677 RepID=UPI001C4E489F|nr:hypothetical protein [Nocardia sp. MH4]MBW0270768.1 hypothetical protein [Nocardia sp. MH4]